MESQLQSLSEKTSENLIDSKHSASNALDSYQSGT